MLAAKVSTSTWFVLLLWCASTIIHAQEQRLNVKCMDQCTFTLVESIPENLTYPASAPILLSTYEAHLRILRNAKSSIHLSTFYWTLLGNDTDFHDYSSYKGESIFNSINAIAKAGNVTVMLAQNNSNADTDILSKNGAQVRTVDFERLIGAGVLHTKMHLVDGQHMYLGSANMDWRSYTQTKELGVLVENCPCLGKDAEKLFQVYWYLGKPDAEVPKHWPEQYSTNINMSDPVLVPFNDTKAPVYLASSPPSFCPDGRTSDIDALLEVVRSAKDFIYISVMDYFPAIIYKKPYRFWPVIDDALRRAVIDRDVTLYLMAAHWAHTHGDMYGYLKSLDDMNRVYRGKVVVKLFTVPATPEQKKIPFARVDHCKYMVTDQHAYIGTSNWSGDYFTATGGLSFVIEQPKNKTVNENGNIRQQLEDVFLRDFFSEYSKIVN
ncbi:5'-3' exonuclease PLD3 isoform X2 [Aplysia californica]|nr:5'-3' exonuclease PLD3 isoform X2 [Aplysia californica]XP_005111970.1 5'-3' exonuclease PLD3 isoform X2 [Aplysia californica]